MRKIIIASVSALCLLTACGVDKDGTGDKLVENLEKAAGTSLSSDQKSCLKDLVNGMSDDEITEISENKASEADQTAFQNNVFVCISDLDVSTDVSTEGSTEETVGS